MGVYTYYARGGVARRQKGGVGSRISLWKSLLGTDVIMMFILI